MTISELYLWLSVFGALWTVQALAGFRTPYALSVFYYVSGWLAGDLARYHIAWQVLATLAFAAAGALAEAPGRIGLAISLLSWAGLLYVEVRKRRARAVLEAALDEALTPAQMRSDAFEPGLLANPFRRKDLAGTVERDIAYGPHGERNLLDVYVPAEKRREPAPVMLWIHGGAWVSGNKEQQGQPLIRTFVANGWVCVANNYRLSPAATFPDHLIDCKRALAWVHENIAAYGGDPECIVVCGGSAGAHLASLMAFSQNDPAYQESFPHGDTSFSACVALYGNFDFVNRFGRRNWMSDMRPSLEKRVMKCSRDDFPEAWEKASPVCRVTPDAPPFFVLHGTHDALLLVEETRDFVRELRKVAKEPVVYAELPGAQHAYDMFFTPHALHSANAILRYAEGIYSARSRAAGP